MSDTCLKWKQPKRHKENDVAYYDETATVTARWRNYLYIKDFNEHIKPTSNLPSNFINNHDANNKR